MSTILQLEPRDPGPFGLTLRRYRQARRMSQLDLALECGVSSRHVSFLESGRAQPSRDMVEQLANGLVLPRQAQNALMHAAGYAPAYPTTALESEVLEPFRAMMAEMMARHAPYPAILVDRYWTIKDANPTAFALLGPLHEGDGPMNVVDMLASDIARTAIANLADVLHEMLGRIQLEALEAVDDATFVGLLATLEAACTGHPVKSNRATRDPIVPLIVATPWGELRFLTAIAHFGTSEDVTVRDLRLELLFPADEATKAILAELPTE
jgi:transcriptional regulator with XRE-family HTH domain